MGNERLPLTLSNASIPGGPLNVFFTEHLFGEAIRKAKELLITELGHILMKTGILQTRDFIAPELYSEYIDSVVRLVWFGLYRELYLQLGLTDMSAGKFAAIASDVSIPTRFIDLCEGILAPVLIGKDVFCPAESLVRCKKYTVNLDTAVVWGIPVDRIVGLPLRYGFTLRNSIVDRIKQFPGSMSNVPDYKEVAIVSRIIRFDELDDVDKLRTTLELDPPNPTWPPLPRGDDIFINDLVAIDTSEASLQNPRLCARYREMAENIHDPADVNYGDLQWFVPFVYRDLPDHDFGRSLASYLPLIWRTAADVDSRNHSVNFSFNEVQTPGSYLPARGNDRRHPRTYVDLSTISDLRRKEGRLSPLDEDEVTNRQNLIQAIDKAWYDNNFPSLEDPNLFVQTTWDLAYQHPFMAVKALTRSTKIGAQGKRPKKNARRQGNIHGATKEGLIDNQE